MKILHTADWHIGQFKGPVVDGVNLRSQDTVKCLEYMVQVAIEEKPDIVCVSGDIFHQEQVGPVRYSDEMITATNIITSLAHFSKYVIVMRGTPNHDGAAQFRVLERMLLNIRNVDVVTEPGVIKTPWADIACLPGFDKQEFRAKFPGLSADEENLAWTKYISDMVFALRAECEKTPILMAHYMVPGCNMESGQTSFFTNFEPVIPREALMAARYKAVLLGHIHRPQIIEGFDNVFYSGAINAMNFNDEGQDRGFWIHEFNEKGTLVKGHRYTTPYRQFRTITWDSDEVGNYIREGVMYLHRTGIPEEVTDGAELSWVGEEGLEYIIPTVPARRQRGIELWKSAGRTLGVLGPDDEISAHASGGIVGKEVSNTTPYFDTDSSSQDSEKTEKETVPTNVVSDKSGVVVQVNLSPQFNISDTNDSDVIRLIKAHIKELADDLGSEIATMLSEAYENTPVTT